MIFKIARKIIHKKYLKVNNQFNLEIEDEGSVSNSVIYISSDEGEEQGWRSDWDTSDSEDEEIVEMTRKAERALSSPMLIAGRVMTCALDEEQSTSAVVQMTPLLPKNFFSNDLCLAPSKRDTRSNSNTQSNCGGR